ncbi:MAG: phage tail sheath family protein, partial [Catenulispora sp.]|nr:phage tail sheath family protein [Catenulispora sp.]
MAPYLSPGVYVEEVEAGSRPIEGVGTAVAAFIGLAARGPAHTPTLVTNWTQFTNAFGEFVEGSYLAHAVYGYFANGGGSCYVVRVGAAEADTAAVSPVTAPAEPAVATGLLGSYPVRALKAGPAGDSIEIEVQAPPTAESDESEPDKPSTDEFKIVVRRGQQREQFTVSTKPGRTNIVTVINQQSKLIAVEEPATATVSTPEAGTVTLSGGASASPAPVEQPTATPATTLHASDYVGDSADRTGFAGLEAVEEVTILAVPDLLASYQQGIIDLDGVLAVQQAMIAHCELMGDRVAIIDPPPGLNAQQIKHWRVDQANYDSKQAALYWP